MIFRITNRPKRSNTQNSLVPVRMKYGKITWSIKEQLVGHQTFQIISLRRKNCNKLKGVSDVKLAWIISTKHKTMASWTYRYNTKAHNTFFTCLTRHTDILRGKKSILINNEMQLVHNINVNLRLEYSNLPLTYSWNFIIIFCNWKYHGYKYNAWSITFEKLISISIKHLWKKI